ncbi:hypothetical protein E4T56_gene20456 [Termitomyces sp. T112]|nr:hypothetical protein E4T56_gene20456 [Termitomyces sp. T112]
MVLAPDNFPAHLPSHSFTTLLFHTTLPFSDNSAPTLVNSGTTDNFINKFLVVLDPQHLQCLSTLILLKLFNSDPTVVLDLFAALLKVLPALIDSRASSTFISSQLDLQHNNLNKLFKLQLFDGSPTIIGITQYHDNTLTLNNDLWFQAWLLITQLPPTTLIVLGLPWLQDVNSDIDWKNLTIQFPSSQARLVAAIFLHLQSVLGPNIPAPGTSTSRAIQSP